MVSRRKVISSAVALPALSAVPWAVQAQADAVVPIDTFGAAVLGETVLVRQAYILARWGEIMRAEGVRFAEGARAVLGDAINNSAQLLRSWGFTGWNYQPNNLTQRLALQEFYSGDFQRAAATAVVGQTAIVLDRVLRDASGLPAAQTAKFLLAEGGACVSGAFCITMAQQALIMHLYHKRGWDEQPARWMGWGLSVGLNAFMAFFLGPKIHNAMLDATKEASLPGGGGRRLLDALAYQPLPEWDAYTLGVNVVQQLNRRQARVSTFLTTPSGYPARSAYQAITLPPITINGNRYWPSVYCDIWTAYPGNQNGIQMLPFSYVEVTQRIRNQTTGEIFQRKLTRRLQRGTSANPSAGDFFNNNTGPIRNNVVPLSALVVETPEVTTASTSQANPSSSIIVPSGY